MYPALRGARLDAGSSDTQRPRRRVYTPWLASIAYAEGRRWLDLTKIFGLLPYDLTSTLPRLGERFWNRGDEAFPGTDLLRVGWSVN